MATGWVYFFGSGQADGDPQRKDILGGKGASLAAMSRAGLPVPPGFTISAQCCPLFLDAPPPPGVGPWRRGDLRRWPAGLERQVRAALVRLEEAAGRKLGDADSPLLVSVRSGAAASMPGMMDTILNCGLTAAMAGRAGNPDAFWRVYNQFVIMFAKVATDSATKEFSALGQQLSDPRQLFEKYVEHYQQRAGRPFPADPWQTLVECIEMVFDSWNNHRAVTYRREHNIVGLAGTAVTVQAMFPSQVAGIVFTANPNDVAAEEMIIESSYGLGEAVVSGDVHPDNFVVDRRSLGIKRRIIGHKAQVVSALGDTATRDPDAPSLSDGQLGELARMALEVEKFFGRPMDIEWGLADGKFALLQARPISTLTQAQEYQRVLESTRTRLRELVAAGRGPWVLHNLGETLPHPTPLTWSVIGRFMSGSGGFGAMYRLAGFAPSPAVSHDGFLELIAGQVYMDVSLAPEMFFAGYPFKYDLDLLRENPEAAQSPPTLPAGSILARTRAARRIARVNRQLHRLADTLDEKLNKEVFPAFADWCVQEKRRDLSGLSPAELVELWRRREQAVMDDFGPQSLLPSLVSAMAREDLRAFLAEHFWDEDGEELAGVLSASRRPDRTMRASAQLYAVARSAQTLESWLTEHGQRGPNEFDLASPRWREQPQEVSALAARLADGADPMALFDAHVRKSNDQLAKLRVGIPKRDASRLGSRSPIAVLRDWSLSPALSARDRRELDCLVRLARRYIGFREDGKYYLMLGYDLLRDLAVEARRRLGLGDDLFRLTRDELFDALQAGSAPAELIERRRATGRAESRCILPRLIDASAIDTLGTPPKLESAGSYPAFAVSTGQASGPAWVAHSPREAGHAGKGYILVCVSTDPAWSPLFINAAGIVLECGGALSHGAILAREMGIPAVVLPGATTLFADGEDLTVDGHHGAVARTAQAAQATNTDAGSSTDLRIPPTMTPPPASRRERTMARVRNVALIAWGIYLLVALAIPEDFLRAHGLQSVGFQSAMDLLDKLLWWLVRGAGKPVTVALVAAALAAITMIGQRLLTDNHRLREAKRRVNRLMRKTAGLDPASPRRVAVTRLSASVQARVLAVALVPLSLILGPMVMTFLWMPARVDPAAWNAPPGSAVSVVASIDSGCRQPVTLNVAPPLSLDDSSPASRTLPPIRETLERLLAEWQAEKNAPAPDKQREIADLRAYLAAGVPAQSVMWQVRAAPDAAGRFPVTVRAGQSPPVTLHIVLGETHPPAPLEALGPAGSAVRSIKVVYPPPEHKRIFWAPLARLGLPWDAGWLITYLAAYLPAMLLLRWTLRIA